MKKLEFISVLHNRLQNLPQTDVEDRLRFYVEMIEDRVEEGISEEEAIAQLGSIDELAVQIMQDIPLARLVKARTKSKKRLETGELILLIAGFPVWLPLLIAAGVVVLALYISLWAVLVSLWAVFVSCAACAVSGVAAGTVFCFGSGLTGVAVIGGGLICAGLAIFMFFGCKAITKGVFLLTKKLLWRVKKSFAEKECAAV